MAGYENASEWAEGYKGGYSLGYSDGVADGRDQGYDDAKYRIKKALEVSGADEEIRSAVQELVGILEDE